jgi:hypothetical protein
MIRDADISLVGKLWGWQPAMTVADDNIYRILIVPDRAVETLCFGVSRVDCALARCYDCVDDLPNWVKERLAVLLLLDGTKPNLEVEGVGRRIGLFVFWVYAPDAMADTSTSV